MHRLILYPVISNYWWREGTGQVKVDKTKLQSVVILQFSDGHGELFLSCHLNYPMWWAERYKQQQIMNKQQQSVPDKKNESLSLANVG